jgi:hypothetical protein
VREIFAMPTQSNSSFYTAPKVESYRQPNFNTSFVNYLSFKLFLPIYLEIFNSLIFKHLTISVSKSEKKMKNFFDFTGQLVLLVR